MDDIEGEVDIAVIVPSKDSAHIITYVLYQISNGLVKHFPEKQSIIINVDGGSTDGTVEIVNSIKLPVKVVSVQEKDINSVKGKGSAIKTGLEIADKMKAKAFATIDSDLRSINEDWVSLLLQPILDMDKDFVSPLYLRYKYDGTITNFIVYPLVRMLSGKRVRQPIGGEFAMSRRIYQPILKHSLWENKETARFGIDVFLTMNALGNHANVCEAILGVKTHDVKDPSLHLAPMFEQVVKSLLNMIEYHEDEWRDVRGSDTLPHVRAKNRHLKPESFEVDTHNMIKMFIEGRTKYKDLLRELLPKEVYALVSSIPSTIENFIYDDELWSKTLIHLVTGYFGAQDARRAEIVDTLRFMWMGRVAYFTIEAADLNDREAEHLLEKQAFIIQEDKDEFIQLYEKNKGG